MSHHFRVIWCWIIVTLKSGLKVTEGHSNWYIRKLGCGFLFAFQVTMALSCFISDIKRLDRMPACDRQTEGQTSCHGIVRAMHTRRAVKMALFMRTRRQTQPNVTYQIIAKNFENGRNEYNSDVVFRAASGKKKHVTNCRHLHDFRRNVPANPQQHTLRLLLITPVKQ